MEAFEKHFPDYSSSDDKLRVLNEDEMKSAQGKKRWRDFMMPFECVFSSLSRRAGITFALSMRGLADAHEAWPQC